MKKLTLFIIVPFFLIGTTSAQNIVGGSSDSITPVVKTAHTFEPIVVKTQPKALVSQDTIHIQSQEQTSIVSQSLPTAQQPVQQTIQPQVIVQMPETTTSSDVSLENNLDSLKTNIESLKDLNSGNGVSIIGTNVIVGNNNTFIIVSDKSQLPDYLQPQLADNDKPKKKYTQGFFDHFSLGLRGSTLGAGIELSTTLSPNFQLRLGYNYFGDITTNSFELKTNDSNIKNAVVGNYNPKYKTKVDFNYNNANALIDFYPMNNGVFHFTAGAYIGKTKLTSNGSFVDSDGNKVQFINPTNIPKVNLLDRQLTIEQDGTMNFDMQFGDVVKPYFGLGLGRAVPKNNFGIKFEFGALYLGDGDIDIKQNGVKLQEADDLDESFKNAKKYTKWIKHLYPVVNFQIVYRFL